MDADGYMRDSKKGRGGGGASEATVKPGSFLPLGPPACWVTGRSWAGKPALERHQISVKVRRIFLVSTTLNFA